MTLFETWTALEISTIEPVEMKSKPPSPGLPNVKQTLSSTDWSSVGETHPPGPQWVLQTVILQTVMIWRVLQSMMRTSKTVPEEDMLLEMFTAPLTSIEIAVLLSSKLSIAAAEM